MFVVDNIEDVEYYKSLASNHNPLLNQVSLKKELAEQGVRVQRSAYFPQIVAMGGGSPELARQADRTCPSVEEDGVAQLLEELGLA